MASNDQMSTAMAPSRPAPNRRTDRITPFCHSGWMELGVVHELVERVAAVDAGCTDRVVLETAVGELRRLKSWVEAREVAVARQLATVASFPEKALADAGRTSVRQAEQAAAPRRDRRTEAGFGVSLDAGRVSGEHLDILARTLRQLRRRRCATGWRDAARLVLLAEGFDTRGVRPHDARRSPPPGNRQRWSRPVGAPAAGGAVEHLDRSRHRDGTLVSDLGSRDDGPVGEPSRRPGPSHVPRHPTRGLSKRSVGETILPASPRPAGVAQRWRRAARVDPRSSSSSTTPPPTTEPVIDWGLPVDLPQRVLDDLYQTGGGAHRHGAQRGDHRRAGRVEPRALVAAGQPCPTPRLGRDLCDVCDPGLSSALQPHKTAPRHLVGTRGIVGSRQLSAGVRTGTTTTSTTTAGC